MLSLVMQPWPGRGRLELAVSGAFNSLSSCSWDGQCLSWPRVFRPPLSTGEPHPLPPSQDIRSLAPSASFSTRVGFIAGMGERQDREWDPSLALHLLSLGGPKQVTWAVCPSAVI